MNTVVTFQIWAYFKELSYKSNRVLFPCLHSLILTLKGSGEFSTVMQTRDYVLGLLEFSQPSLCLDEVR